MIDSILTIENIILGVVDIMREYVLSINQIILFGKYFIYICKNNTVNLTLSNFKRYLINQFFPILNQKGYENMYDYERKIIDICSEEIQKDESKKDEINLSENLK